MSISFLISLPLNFNDGDDNVGDINNDGDDNCTINGDNNENEESDDCVGDINEDDHSDDDNNEDTVGDML